MQVHDGVEIGFDDALEDGKRLIEAGNLLGALRRFARALPRHASEEALLTAAADAWVAAVDQASLLDGWSNEERDFLQRSLIKQEGCSVSPPILHHRIAAQHSSGVAGHLGRAAAALEPTLEKLLADGDPDSNTVLMLLLLRSDFSRIDQRRISALHHARFAGFGEGDLRIPYSALFDRIRFRRNIADLSEYVRTRSEEIVAGSVPLNSLLLLFWSVPKDFDRLPPDWSARAVAARLRLGRLAPDEAAAARSLAMRFDGVAHRALVRDGGYADYAVFPEVMEAVASARNALRVDDDREGEAAAVRLNARPRQAFAAAWNLASAHLPALARIRRKPKVAVCVSGQLRGFRQAWRSWRPLLAGIEATVFVSSWSRIGRGTANPYRSVLPFEGDAFANEYRAVGIEIGMERLQERHPGLFAALERSGKVTESELSDFYGTPHVELDDEDASPFRDFTNFEKMYHKIERCFRMAEASGETFDLILRIRPDKPIAAVAFDWADMVAAAHARPRLYCETAMGVHYGALLMGDQVALGSPEASRVYAETWSATDGLRRLELFKLNPELHAHVSVAQTCWLHDIDVRKVPIKFDKFLEAEPLPALAIKEALAWDAAGRMDSIDRRFIAANAADLKSR